MLSNGNGLFEGRLNKEIAIWATCGNVWVIVMISALSHNTHVFLSEVLYHVITTSNDGKVPNES